MWKFERLRSKLKTLEDERLDNWHNSMASVIWNRSPYLVVVIDSSLWNMKLPSVFGICNCHLWYLFWYFNLRHGISGGGWAGHVSSPGSYPLWPDGRKIQLSFMNSQTQPLVVQENHRHHQYWTSRSSGSVKENFLIIIIIANKVQLIPKPT